MKKIKVQNIKCSGCVTKIKSDLEVLGATKVNVDVESGEVSFEGDKKLVEQKLESLGYPKADSKNTVLIKSKSYLSCLIGKTKVKN